MKNIVRTRSVSFDFDNSVFIMYNKYDGIKRFEVLGAKVTEYDNGLEDSVQLYGFELTKAGKRRKNDYRREIWMDRELAQWFEGNYVFVDTPAKSLYDQVRSRGIDLMYERTHSGGYIDVTEVTSND